MFIMEKRIGCVLVLVFLILISFVSAITGSMGNARMILTAEVGDQIEKYILVKNVNNVSLDIELFASGDLEDSITILDDSFSLAPGDEKKAKFLIDVTKGGTTETSINVKFTPVDGGNGVGLMSTVIVRTTESGSEVTGEPVTGNGNDEMEGDGEKNILTVLIVGVGGNVGVIAVVVMALVLVLLVIVYLFMLKKTKSKKDVVKK